MPDGVDQVEQLSRVEKNLKTFRVLRITLPFLKPKLIIEIGLSKGMVHEQ